MSTFADRMPHAVATSRLRTGSTVMAVAGIGFIGYAVAFFARNFTNAFLEMGIGPNEVNVGRAQIEAFSPSLYQYVSHLHIAVSGFIAATGIAVTALAWYGVRRGQVWAYVTALVVPVVGLAVALPAHYANHFDTMGHLGLIYADTLLFLVGAVLAGLALRDRAGEEPARD